MVEILEIQGEEMVDETVRRGKEASYILATPGKDGKISYYDALVACLATRTLVSFFKDEMADVWEESEELFDLIWPNMQK